MPARRWPARATSSTTVRRPPSLASMVLFYGASAATFGLALQHTFATRHEAMDRFERYESDEYWRRRLNRDLLLAGTQFYLSGFVSLTGALLVDSDEQGRQASGKRVLLVSLVPRVITAIVVTALTPRDWWQGALNLVPAAMVTTGMIVW